jgi:hypothetical protein
MKCDHVWEYIGSAVGLYQKGVRNTFGPLPIKRYFCPICGTKSKEWDIQLIYFVSGVKLTDCGKEEECCDKEE